jgi:hypothetical protein
MMAKAALLPSIISHGAQKRSNAAYQGTRTTQPSVIPVALPMHAAGQRTRTTTPTPPCDLINVIQLKQNGYSQRLRAESSRSHTTHHISFLRRVSHIALGGPLP